MYDLIVYRPLQRMCAGMLLAALSFIFAAFLQLAVQRSRLHVIQPPNGFANLKIINAAPCSLNVSGLELNANIPVDEVNITHCLI